MRPGVDGSAALLLALAAAVVAALPGALRAQAAPPGTDAPASREAEDGAPLVGDRPDFTESASVVGRLQLETGYTYEDDGSSEIHTVGELLLRVPAARRLEVRIGVPSWSGTDADEGAAGGESPLPTGEEPADGPRGMTDASLGVKIGLREPGPEGGGPALALLAGTTLPTGGDVGSDGLHPGGLLAADVDLSGRVSLGANAGVASAEEGGIRYAKLSGSLALGVGLTEEVGLYLEGYGFVPTGDGPASSSVVDGGITWLAGPDLQLDLRLGTGLSGPSPDVIFGTGVVWRP
jgi:hypothetical protein